MDLRIVITDEGKLTIFTDTGTFEDGKKIAANLFKALEAAGVEIDELGQAEQHRHDHEHDHEHAHTHVHTHN